MNKDVNITITINSDMTAVEIVEAIQAQIPVKKEFPKWKELGQIDGTWVTDSSNILSNTGMSVNILNRNVWPTKELAEASLALSQLAQLRDYVNGDWKSDWKFTDAKYVIEYFEGELLGTMYCYTQHFLAFKGSETRDGFLEAYRDLIEIAKPLL